MTQGFVSSKERIESQKLRFKNILDQIKAKDAYSNKEIEDKTNKLLVVNSENGLKIGPVFGNFDEQSSYGKSYEEIVKNLALSVNPYEFNLEKNRYKENIQDVVKSIRPVDLEIDLQHKLSFSFDEDSILNPIGFKAKLAELNVIGNPKVPWQTDSVLDDKLKAVDMINYLIDYGFNSYYITRIFSAGLLGIDKKFVTTRQSITATDDTITKILLNKVREFDENDKYLVYENEFLHNHFFIVFLPGKWEYEQFECWPDPQGTRSPSDGTSPKSNLNWNILEFGFNQEYETFYGRTAYAENQAGGYYAARIGIVEHLIEEKKQAKVVVFREIYDEYSVPVGVWQVRENVSHALFKKPKEFQSEQEIKNYLKKAMKSNLDNYLKVSKILGQKRIVNFFGNG